MSKAIGLKGGTIIKLPDGRTGTITWNHLDGCGGIFGEHDFTDVPQGFDDGWPTPEFMLREKGVEKLIRAKHPDDDWHSKLTGQDIRNKSHRADLECVGEEFEVIQLPSPTLN